MRPKSSEEASDGLSARAGELWCARGTPSLLSGARMQLLKSLAAFLAIAAFAAAASVSVSRAADPAAPQQEQDLPDLGSPATAAVSLEEEFQVGQSWARQMRAQGIVLEDPEVTDYIQQLGHSLSSHAEEGQHQFNYAVVRDPDRKSTRLN